MLIADIYHKHPKTIGPDTAIAHQRKLAGLAQRGSNIWNSVVPLSPLRKSASSFLVFHKSPGDRELMDGKSEAEMYHRAIAG